MAQTNPVGTRRDGAYTLIEMMVVMVILIVVMALVAPIIGNARNAAKRTITRQLLSNLSQASQQFEIDNRTLPGYFSPVDMGSNENITRGFSEMNNILLDLSGGRIEITGGPPADAIQVGPTNTAMAYVRVGLIGAPTQTKGVVNKGYFTPDPKYFKPQDGAHKVASIAGHPTSLISWTASGSRSSRGARTSIRPTGRRSPSRPPTPGGQASIGPPTPPSSSRRSSA